jgi:hypothetical protein
VPEFVADLYDVAEMGLKRTRISKRFRIPGQPRRLTSEDPRDAAIGIHFKKMVKFECKSLGRI